jgi:hypothetical protein
MKNKYSVLILIILFCNGQFLFAKSSGEITINLTEKRKIHEVQINKDLILRVVKDSSVKHKDFGWIIEVIRKPFRKNSRNLIYQNKTGTTADLSQIYAWHIGSLDFPNDRKLKIMGYPLTVKINLLNPKTKGEGPDARFVAGKLKIIWK